MDSSVSNLYLQLIKGLPWWVWVLFVIGVVSYFVKFIKGIGGYKGDETVANKKEGFNPRNYEVRQTLMTSNERIFFEKLRRAIGDKYDIYPQVNLDKIFKIKYLGGRSAFNAAKWAIDRRSIDFLITKRESQSPYIGIELDDSTHYREDRVNRDEKVNALFRENGIELIRVNGVYGISEQELRMKFL